jgi:hypothetical protein
MLDWEIMIITISPNIYLQLVRQQGEMKEVNLRCK